MDLAYTYDRVSSLQRHFPPSTDAEVLMGKVWYRPAHFCFLLL